MASNRLPKITLCYDAWRRKTDGRRERRSRVSAHCIQTPKRHRGREQTAKGGSHTLTCKPIWWRLRESYMISGIILHIRGGGNKKRGRLAQRRMTTLNSAEANVPWRKKGGGNLRKRRECQFWEGGKEGGHNALAQYRPKYHNSKKIFF